METGNDNETTEEVNVSSIPSIEEKLLYVDGLNFGNEFGFITLFWNTQHPMKKITEFVNAATKSGYTLRVFIDAGIESEEALEKWKQRREDEVRKEIKDASQGMSILMGDMFRRFAELKVEVGYSPIEADNDDCIASHAQHHGGDILSNDRDFFRYRDAKYKLYGSFTITDDGYLKLHVKETPKPRYDYKTKKLIEEAPLRDIISPPPVMLSYAASFNSVLKNNHYRRGVPCSLVKIIGNSNSALVDLRASIYIKLGKTAGDEIIEEYPRWSDERNEVFWHRIKVEPNTNCDADFRKLNPNELWMKYFYIAKGLYLYDAEHIELYRGVKEHEHLNRCFAEFALIAELYSIFHYNSEKSLSVLDIFEKWYHLEGTLTESTFSLPCESRIVCNNWFKDGMCKFEEKCFAKAGHHDCLYLKEDDYCRRGKYCIYRHSPLTKAQQIILLNTELNEARRRGRTLRTDKSLKDDKSTINLVSTEAKTIRELRALCKTYYVIRYHTKVNDVDMYVFAGNIGKNSFNSDNPNPDNPNEVDPHRSYTIVYSTIEKAEQQLHPLNVNLINGSIKYAKQYQVVEYKGEDTFDVISWLHLDEDLTELIDPLHDK